MAWLVVVLSKVRNDVLVGVAGRVADDAEPDPLQDNGVMPFGFRVMVRLAAGTLRLAVHGVARVLLCSCRHAGVAGSVSPDRRYGARWRQRRHRSSPYRSR